jgi:hypothetical protein
MSGLRGWGYFTETQGEYDSVTVKMDFIDYDKLAPENKSALGATRRRKLNDVAWDTMLYVSERKGVWHNVMVRMRLCDLTVLSDLEALLEPEADVEYPRLR